MCLLKQWKHFLNIKDLPKFDADDLHKFSKNVVVKVGQTASFKIPLPPQAPTEISWFKEGTELFDGGSIKVVKELNQSRLQIKDCLQSYSGEIKIQLKNTFGIAEAFSGLIVVCMFLLHWVLYWMYSEINMYKPSAFYIQTHTLTLNWHIKYFKQLCTPADEPGAPEGPVEVIDSSSSVIELKWKPPSDTSGSEVTNYLVERQQVGQSMWKKVCDSSADRLSFRDRNVSRGKKNIYQIYAENSEGISDPLETEAIIAGALSERLHEYLWLWTYIMHVKNKKIKT